MVSAERADANGEALKAGQGTLPLIAVLRGGEYSPGIDAVLRRERLAHDDFAGVMAGLVPYDLEANRRMLTFPRGELGAVAVQLEGLMLKYELLSSRPEAGSGLYASIPACTMRFPSSIQSRVTLLVLTFGFTLLVINTVRNDAWLRERQWKRVVDAAESEGSLLAGMMQHCLRNDLTRAAELQMSYSSTADDLKSGVVLDHDDRIAHATRRDWVGMPLAVSPMANENAPINQVRRSMNSAVQRREGELAVVAFFPFFTSFESTSRGVVVLHYDLTGALARARLYVLHELASQACLMIALCVRSGWCWMRQ